MGRDDDLRDPLAIGLLDLGEARREERLEPLVPLAKVEDPPGTAGSAVGTTVGNHVAIATSDSGRVADPKASTTSTGTLRPDPAVAGVLRDDPDVVPAGGEPLGALHDDPDTAGDTDRLDDPDDLQPTCSQVAGTTTSPLVQLSDSTRKRRSLRES